MSTAFQSDAFQNSAFQIDTNVGVIVFVSGVYGTGLLGQVLVLEHI
jgi:hypothetical protein